MEDQSTNKEPTGENKRLLISSDLATPIYGLFGLGILYTLYVAHQIVLPIILAVMTSLLLSPLVKKAYVKWRIPRMISSLPGWRLGWGAQDCVTRSFSGCV